MEWVLDSSASHQMTFNFTPLANVYDFSTPIVISQPDGR